MSGQIPHIYKDADKDLTKDLGEHHSDGVPPNNGTSNFGEHPNSAKLPSIGDSDSTTVLDGIANQIRADSNATTVIDLDATTVINDADATRAINDAEATTIINDANATTIINADAVAEQPFQNGQAEVLPDSAFEPKTHSQKEAYFEPSQNANQASPSYTSVLPAELIAERTKRAQSQNAAQGRFEASGYSEQNYSDTANFDIPQTKAEKKAAKKAQKQANKANGEKPKKHGCLIAFVTFVIMLALIAYGALFALSYASEQSGVSKDEIIARLAKPINDFFQI